MNCHSIELHAELLTKLDELILDELIGATGQYTFQQALDEIARLRRIVVKESFPVLTAKLSAQQKEIERLNARCAELCDESRDTK